MCADAQLVENPHSILIASTATSHVGLSRYQSHAGFLLVFLRAHATDMTDLGPTRLAAFWRDVQRAGRAIDRVYTPRKIDYLIMGHRMPHLHCHVFPQHSHDDPLRNVDISEGSVSLDPVPLRGAARAVREAWEQLC